MNGQVNPGHRSDLPPYTPSEVVHRPEHRIIHRSEADHVAFSLRQYRLTPSILDDTLCVPG